MRTLVRHHPVLARVARLENTVNPQVFPCARHVLPARETRVQAQQPTIVSIVMPEHTASTGSALCVRLDPSVYRVPVRVQHVLSASTSIPKGQHVWIARPGDTTAPPVKPPVASVQLEHTTLSREVRPSVLANLASPVRMVRSSVLYPATHVNRASTARPSVQSLIQHARTVLLERTTPTLALLQTPVA
jgi:hypothetical protein